MIGRWPYRASVLVLEALVLMTIMKFASVYLPYMHACGQ